MKNSLKRIASSLLVRARLPVTADRLRRGRTGIILMYHRVNAEGDAFFPALHPEAFAAQIDYVREHYEIVGLDSLVRWLREGAPGPPRVAVTIDDGYPDTHSQVLPRLKARGVPATLFLATSPPETGRPVWLDRLRHLVKQTLAPTLQVPGIGLGPAPLATEGERLAALRKAIDRLKGCGGQQVEDVMGDLEEQLDAGSLALGPAVLSWDQVREMAGGGIAIGGHTHRHYMLSRLTRSQARDEIATSLELIESRVGRRPSGFAYPNGTAADYTRDTVEVLTELGVPWACTTLEGRAGAASPSLELPRVYTSMTALPQFALRVAGWTGRGERVVAG